MNQPKAVDTPVAFPDADVEGNDDPLNGTKVDEDTNPYRVFTNSPRLNHQIGELSSYDAPLLRVVDAWGAPARNFSLEYNFREFSRVELWDGKRKEGQFWF